MNIKSFPNNQDEYVGAEHLMRWFHGRTSGVWGAEGNAAVASVPDQMQVTVSDGTGWLASSKTEKNKITTTHSYNLQNNLLTIFYF